MCSAPKIDPPIVPPPPPDFSDQQAALALDVERTRQFQAFSGLAGTIKPTGAAGVLTPTRTTRSPNA